MNERQLRALPAHRGRLRGKTRAMFEVQMEDCLLHGDSSRLVSLIHYEGLSSTTLSRLDQLVTKDLCGSGSGRVLLVLKSLGVLSENRDDLQTLISHGLTAKLLLWFEAVHDLLTSDLQRGSAPLLSLTEEFFDYFLLLGQASLPASQLSVVILHLARFALESLIHFPLRLEAIRTFNSILESLSRDQRRLIQNDQNQIQILSQVAAAVLTVGDYELQVSLSEALCRLTPRRDRQQRANQWFSSDDISKAFCDIRDADFEVDCRRFLNFVNGYHGDQRRVYTFPCLRAFLNSTQLFCPKDDKLDDFWIDFNVGSGCVSFFIDDPQGFLWGSIHLLKEEVDHYSLQLKQDDTVLTVRLKNPIMHHKSRGQTVELSFSCVHHRELEEAAGSTFKKEQSSPQTAEAGGTDQAGPSAQKCSVQSYSRKKPPSKSHLKILPLSSPSSEEDSFLSQAAIKNRAEILFDQIRTSTPAFDSGFQSPFDLADVSILKAHPSDSAQPEPGSSEAEELQIPQEETVEVLSNNSPTKKEVLGKREAADSGYLSDQTEGAPPQKKKAEPQQDGEESNLPQTECSVVEKQEGRVLGEGAWPADQKGKQEAEPFLTSDITAAFRTFKAQLEQHFTGCWKKVETEVLLSLKECQRHVSSLLTAVHRHRLLLLQQFESSVTDQLKHLEETSAHLNSMNTQILSFFQSEMQRFGSFCEEHLEKLKSLERPSSQ